MSHSQKFLRQRKFLVVLPLIVVPFLSLFFWALGGGKGEEAVAQTNITKGLNLKLPDAQIKEEKGTDKMSLYSQADKDSMLLKQEMQLDPYYKDNVAVPAKTSPAFPMNSNEQRVNEKLQQLQAVINQPQEQKYAAVSPAPDIDRLQKMMQVMQHESESNGEMKQLNGMMDKLLDLQHPERVKEQSLKNREQAFVVSLTDTTKRMKGFYALNDNLSKGIQNSIAAIIPETQTLTAGATVKLLLLNDIFINGILVPHNSFVFGTASLSNERLKVTIASLRYLNNILPVSLEVYDMDGLAGIYVPGSINRDVAKESSDNTINSLGLTTLDPSLGAQAAGAGIQTAKTLLSKKVRLVKVTIKAGYLVLLKDNNKN